MLLIQQTDYEPDALAAFFSSFTSIALAVLASLRIAQYQMLENSMALVDILQDVMGQEQK